MAQTLSSWTEVAKKLKGFRAARCGGFFDGIKIAYKLSLPASANGHNKLPGPVAVADAAKPGFVVAAYRPVRGVVKRSASSDIAAPIVKSVVVDVVNKRARPGETKKHPVHQHRLLRTAASKWILYAGRGVERLAKTSEFASVPFVLADKRIVSRINKRNLTFGQWNLNHRRSLGNTLSGVSATRKVRAFGDQPSRDSAIVG